MAIKIAPVQGWGVYWNAAHPDQPFAPVVVDLAAPSGTAGAQAGAPAADSSAPSQLIAPVTGLSAATPLTGALPAAPQAVTLSGAAASQADGTHVSSDTGSAAISDAGSAEAAALQSLNHSHASDSLPFSGPAAESDGGQGGSFDIVAGDFSTDWFVV